MYFIYYKYRVNGLNPRMSFMPMPSLFYAEESRVIDIHPLTWMKQQRDMTLVSWKKLTEEEIIEYNKELPKNPIKQNE